MHKKALVKELLEENQKIVEYYQSNPTAVIKLVESKDLDSDMLKEIANMLCKIVTSDKVNHYTRMQSKKTLIAVILAIKEMERSQGLEATTETVFSK